MQGLNDNIVGKIVFLCRVNGNGFRAHFLLRLRASLRLRELLHKMRKTFEALRTENWIEQGRVTERYVHIRDALYDEWLAVLQIDRISH